MSLGTCCLVCFGFYKLGFYTARNPDGISRLVKSAWERLKQQHAESSADPLRARQSARGEAADRSAPNDVL